jgi:hypothetical protein
MVHGKISTEQIGKGGGVMKASRITALSVLLLLALLFVTLSAPFSLIFGIHHDCTGEHCHVCALILACVSASVHLTRAAAVILFAFAGTLCLSVAVRSLKRIGRGADLSGKGIRLLN